MADGGEAWGWRWGEGLKNKSVVRIRPTTKRTNTSLYGHRADLRSAAVFNARTLCALKISPRKFEADRL